jgi:hypothetical protein
MRRDESVFFFTLVDFLLTALFFGLVLFAVGQAHAQHEKGEQTKWVVVADSLRKATGVSDLTVLTDRLTRLGPLRNAEEATRLVKQVGGLVAARKALATVGKAGGSDTVAARLERLLQREGAGKPHCLFNESRGVREAVVLASVIATDSTLSFERETAHLSSVLASIGRNFDEVRVLRLREFRQSFERLRAVQPSCMYTIDFVERTRYVDARDAVRGIFYTRIRHQ